ncbi:hypothetical protein LINPERPRIM_LOCUS22152, partial [Linum perenne]
QNFHIQLILLTKPFNFFHPQESILVLASLPSSPVDTYLVDGVCRGAFALPITNLFRQPSFYALDLQLLPSVELLHDITPRYVCQAPSLQVLYTRNKSELGNTRFIQPRDFPFLYFNQCHLFYGNDVAIEVNVKNGNRYVTMGSSVSVRNKS